MLLHKIQLTLINYCFGNLFVPLGGESLFKGSQIHDLSLFYIRSMDFAVVDMSCDP